MGTRGYIVIKFRNRYYRIYNHWDSYPSGLGNEVVDYLKRLREDGKLEQTEDCVQRMIAHFSAMKSSLAEEGDAHLDIMIEWVYKIDIDEMSLAISGWDEQNVFDMSYVHDNWLKIFDR